MNKPNYVKVNDELYKINTDFRVALECNKIALDKSIGNYERALAIVYKLFGEKGLDCIDQNKLFTLGMQYLSLGRQQNSLKNDSNNKYEPDFEKSKGLIESSFKFDYKYNPYELEYMHWYDFYNDLENLSTSEFGNCCILNRVISILNQDTSKIKDEKEKRKLLDTIQELRKRYCVEKEEKVEITEKQKNSAIQFYKSLGYDL